MYPRYQSRSGYFNQDDQTDGYGVDHSGFSLRDELLYQTARKEREQELFENFNRQGVDESYPWLGTSFWGNSADNYGFGRSNIENNIKKRQFPPVLNAGIQNAVQKRAMMTPTQSRNDFAPSFETKTSDRVKRLYPETSPVALIVRLALTQVLNHKLRLMMFIGGMTAEKIRIKLRAGTVTEQMTVVVLPILRLLRLLWMSITIGKVH